MSWMSIDHATTYRYRVPVRFARHRLLLRPREGHDIRVEKMSLEIQPRASLEWSRDVFGNSVADVHFHEKSDLLRIRSRVLLRQTRDPLSQRAHLSKTPLYPMIYEPEEEIFAAAYRETIYPEDLATVKAWVDQTIDTDLCDGAESVAALVNEAVHEAVRYTRREEHGVLSPAETLEGGSGSCRDQSTLLLEALRLLGFPARFVSGYLDCQASEAGRASTHAWAEVYLPGTGWIGFDPTLNERTSSRHVVVGVSNHPQGVMPIVGSFFGRVGDFIDLRVAVKTERLDEDPELTLVAE
jgi:transglutaminase-like putative cysteine protease